MMLERPKPVTKTGLNERSIARVLAVGFFARKYLVMVPNCNWTGHECDLLALDEKLRVIDIEVKISRADLKADADKDKWWHREFKGYGPVEEKHDARGRLISRHQPALYDKTLREWPPKAWKHYYCLPADIWSDDLLDALPSSRSGVILLEHDRHGGLRHNLKRRAQPNKDAKPVPPEQAVNIARLASLRMWEWELVAAQRGAELQRYRDKE